jgi:hypothetical protein
MFVDAQYTVTIKITDFFVNSQLSEEEIGELLIKEGDRRVSHFISGYLFDPENKIISRNVIINNKTQ